MSDLDSSIRPIGRGAHLALLAIASLLGGCFGAGRTSDPGVAPDPTHATVVEGRWETTFTISRTTLRPGDSIEGEATLRLLEVGEVPLSTSGSGVFAFSFIEVAGLGRSAVWLRPGDCSSSSIASGAPITSAIRKSGAYGDGPNSDFIAQFLKGSDVRLPVGEWDITANAAFTDGPACHGDDYSMDATVRVRVIE